MCGIFGYVGPRPSDTVILDGLKRLEYRGYDSAGIAVVRQGELLLRRATGKLRNLSDALQAAPLGGEWGVGHTRWATHGRPTEENAHPHRDCKGRIVVVHNGIIENYMELKEELIAAGHTFVTQTDTEVVAHLVESRFKGDLPKAVLEATERLRGSYALVLLSVDAPGTLVATRSGPSLIVGIGEGETYVSSDLPALVTDTREVLFPEDEDIVVLTREGAKVMGADGRTLERRIQRIDWDPIRAEKGGKKHFMLKEIAEQPAAIRDTLVGRYSLDEGEVYLEETGFDDATFASFEQVSLIACGTAFHACLEGKSFIEALARVPVMVDVASEFRYRDPIVGPKTLTIAVTQSGETADTVAALRESAKRGSRVLAICNVRGSLATREAEGTLLTHAGPEIGVASTKAFTAQLAALALVAAKLALVRGTRSHDRVREFLAALARLPHMVEQALAVEPAVEAVARRFSKSTNMLYLGRGPSYPIALEGALKLKELSYIHAEGYPAGEMKHGPIALIDEQMPIVAVAPRDAVQEKTLSNVQEARARGGVVIAIGEEGDETLASLSDEFLPVPKTHDLLSPFLTVLPLQLLAYHIAEKLGCDVDQPRNLAKSVTVE